MWSNYPLKMPDARIKIKKLFIDTFHVQEKDVNISALPLSGSQRRYYRIESPAGSFIACFSQNVEENSCFISLSRFLRAKGIKVPEIYAVDYSLELYILEDLGDTDLLSLIRKNQFTNGLMERIVSQLTRLQRLPMEEWENIVGFPPLDDSLIEYDFQYAVRNLIEPLLPEYDNAALRHEFQTLKKRLLEYPRELWGLMFRDFQSRNIMVDRGEVYFIDYQSARFGPGIYDLVSFAWQAKAGFTTRWKEKIIDLYIEMMEREGMLSRNTIMENIPYWAMFRIIQTLGAYGLRGLKEGKKHFIESLPPALHNLLELLAPSKTTRPTYLPSDRELKEEFPELAKVGAELLNFL